MKKCTLRLLHHWACSGGTLISKCLCMLPGVVFLNEVHPLAHLRLLRNPNEDRYCPTDICRQLSYPHNGRDPALIMASFRGSITALLEKTEQEKLHLVIRSHDHIDFFLGPLPALDYTFTTLFKNTSRLLNILTVRHPLDCWLTLLETEWHKQISLHSFDEFCQRCLLMLEASENIPRFQYERFVLNPNDQLQAITQALELTFDPQALEDFGKITLSGSSGRQSSAIEPRPRRPFSKQLELEAAKSRHYEHLCRELAYQDSPSCDFPYLS